jgi:hypothetical protein
MRFAMRQILLILSVLVFVIGTCTAQEEEKRINLRVLYVGSTATPRGKAYAQFLTKHFRQAAALERQGFDAGKAAGYDVVLLDWSQQERPEKPMSPLGSREAWGTPTVLLGSAGLLLAEAWEIHGTIG